MNETEVGKLLRYVFNRPARVTVLVCLCGKTADLKKSLKAWNGWQCLPFAVCPECLAAGRYRHVLDNPTPCPAQARERYLDLVNSSRR